MNVLVLPSARAFLATARSIWAWMLMACVVASSLAAVATFHAVKETPVQLLSLSEAGEPMLKDGALVIRFKVVRHQTCEGTVERWLRQDTGLREDDGEKIYTYASIPIENNPPTRLGQSSTYFLVLPLPKYIGPGVWQYWSRTYDHCSWFPGWFSTPPRDSPATAGPTFRIPLVEP